MSVTKVEYLERFIEAVDRVIAGRPGSISEDRWLVNYYDAEKLPIVSGYLDCDDERVRAETVLLLSDVHERAVLGKVREMRQKDSERVRLACIGYLSTIQGDDELIPQLFDVMDHSSGNEFMKAAARMASVAREEDVPHLRRIYGQVGGEMRSAVRVALDRVISRNPSLQPKRDLILSVPVYPNEGEFERFLDSSIEYLDVRYRNNVLPLEKVKLDGPRQGAQLPYRLGQRRPLEEGGRGHREEPLPRLPQMRRDDGLLQGHVDLPRLRNAVTSPVAFQPFPNK